MKISISYPHDVTGRPAIKTHALLHDLFHWPFACSVASQTLISPSGVLPSSCGMLYYIFDAQKILRPRTRPDGEWG